MLACAECMRRVFSGPAAGLQQQGAAAAASGCTYMCCLAGSDLNVLARPAGLDAAAMIKRRQCGLARAALGGPHNCRCGWRAVSQSMHRMTACAMRACAFYHGIMQHILAAGVQLLYHSPALPRTAYWEAGGGGHQQLRHAAHRLCSLFALSTSVISCLLCRLACSGAGYSLVTQPSVGRSLHRPSSTHDCAPLGPATTLARPNIGLHAPSTGPWSFLALDSSGLWCCNLRAAARVAGGGEGELPPKQPARPSPQAAPHSWPTIINAQSSLPSIFCIL